MRALVQYFYALHNFPRVEPFIAPNNKAALRGFRPKVAEIGARFWVGFFGWWLETNALGGVLKFAQPYTRHYGGPSARVSASWCIFTERELAYIRRLLAWTNDMRNEHFITGHMDCADLAGANVWTARLPVVNPIGWSISKTTCFKVIGCGLNSPQYLLSCINGHLLFASPPFVRSDNQDDTVMYQLANRQKLRVHRAKNHSPLGRPIAWLKRL